MQNYVRCSFPFHFWDIDADETIGTCLEYSWWNASMLMGHFKEISLWKTYQNYPDPVMSSNLSINPEYPKLSHWYSVMITNRFTQYDTDFHRKHNSVIDSPVHANNKFCLDRYIQFQLWAIVAMFSEHW